MSVLFPDGIGSQQVQESFGRNKRRGNRRRGSWKRKGVGIRESLSSIHWDLSIRFGQDRLQHHWFHWMSELSCEKV